MSTAVSRAAGRALELFIAVGATALLSAAGAGVFGWWYSGGIAGEHLNPVSVAYTATGEAVLGFVYTSDTPVSFSSAQSRAGSATVSSHAASPMLRSPDYVEVTLTACDSSGSTTPVTVTSVPLNASTPFGSSVTYAQSKEPVYLKARACELG